MDLLQHMAKMLVQVKHTQNTGSVTNGKRRKANGRRTALIWYGLFSCCREGESHLCFYSEYGAQCAWVRVRGSHNCALFVNICLYLNLFRCKDPLNNAMWQLKGHRVHSEFGVPRTETDSHICASLHQYLPLSEPLQLRAKGKKRQKAKGRRTASCAWCIEG